MFVLYHLSLTGLEMKTLVRLTLVLVLSILTVCVAERNFVSAKYEKLKSAQNLIGTKRAEFTARSVIECSLR